MAFFVVFAWVSCLGVAADPIPATVVRVAPEEIVLKSGTTEFHVVDTVKTKFWVKCALGTRDLFHPGDQVFVRLKTSTVPTEVREMADKSSAAWLTNLRKNIVKGTVKAMDAKYVTFEFADGTQLAYRATLKSKIHLKGASATFTDLKEGQTLYVKGRTLATLDLWLASASDIPPVVTPKETKSGKKGKRTASPVEVGTDGDGKSQPAIGMLGTIESKVVQIVPAQSMFDIIYRGQITHITVARDTAFSAQGRKVPFSFLQSGMKVKIDYHRNQFGLIIATRIRIVG